MRRSRRWIEAFLLLAGCWFAAAGQVATTTVQGTVYRADGTPASGTLLVSWPQFSTGTNQAVAAGSKTVVIGGDGFVSLNLAANLGASPAGSYYTAVYHLNDGTVSREYWVVPASGTATIAGVRAQLEPSTVAVQPVTKQYVDSAVSSITGNYLPVSGGTMGGPLVLGSDPTAVNQAATKHYVDNALAGTVPKAGGMMTGPLSTPNAINKLPRVDIRHSDFAGGADPTGQHDSTAAFQAAIAYALATQQQPGELSYPAVYCAPGRYIINGTLRIPNTLHLIGDGVDACHLVETNPTANLITVYQQQTYAGGGAYLGSIEGVTLEGSGHGTSGTLLEVDNSAQYSILNLQMSNSGGRGLVLNGSSERFSSTNLYVNSVRWPITLSGDENESYFVNTQVMYPGSTSDNYCYSVNCVNGQYPGANQGPGGSATPITPDPHAAIYVGDADNFRFIGGSVKPLKYVGGFHLFSSSVSDISSFYCEGFPDDNAPRLNACVSVGGAAQHTTLTAALSGTGNSVVVADTSWFPEFYGNPQDASGSGAGHQYAIMPADYLSGSTAASAAVAGVQRGQYELVFVSGFAGDGKAYFSSRNNGGSTAPANTAWPAGSVIEQVPQPYGAYGTVTLDQDHINAMQPPQSGYTDNCDQTGTRTCAELIFGFEPDGLFYDPLGGPNHITSGLNTFVNMNGSEMFSGSYSHTGEIAVHGYGSFVLNGSGELKGGETAAVTSSSGQKLNLNAVTGGSYLTAPTYGNGNTAQVTVRMPSEHSIWVSGPGPFYASEASIYGQGGPNNSLQGTQFANQYCWFDVPSTGTQPGMRFCMNGGPKNGANQGLEYDQWNGSSWVSALHLGTPNSGTAGLSLNGAAAIGGGLTAASINKEITVDGATYPTLNAAWNAAAAEAVSTGQDQTVRLGPGTYPVTATMMEPSNGACVSLVGSAGSATGADTASVATTLTVSSALGGDVFFAGNTIQAQGCTFKDLNILAQKNATHGFEMQWVRSLLMDNVAVNDTTAEGILVGEETTSGGHQAGFLLRNITVSYSSAAFSPASRPAYGVHLEKTAMDGELHTVTVRNALTAGVFNEGTGNTGYLIHGFGYPYTCTTGPCANNAASGTATNASYASSYVIYDAGGQGSVWTDTYADSPSVAAFYIGANGVTIHGGHIQWPELTSFPKANLAYVAATVTNGLTIADIGCLGMASGTNWVTYAANYGVPPQYTSVHHLTGCGNYYQALDPAPQEGLSSGGANINDSSGASPRFWVSPFSGGAKNGAFGAQYYSGYEGDLLQGHFSGNPPFFNITSQGTVRTNGGLATSTVINTAASLTLNDGNKTVLANATSGAETLTLTDCSGTFADGAARTGQEFTVVKTDASANAVTITPVNSQTVSYGGTVAANLVIGSAGARTLVCGPDHNWYAH